MIGVIRVQLKDLIAIGHDGEIGADAVTGLAENSL